MNAPHNGNGSGSKHEIVPRNSYFAPSHRPLAKYLFLQNKFKLNGRELTANGEHFTTMLAREGRAGSPPGETFKTKTIKNFSTSPKCAFFSKSNQGLGAHQSSLSLAGREAESKGARGPKSPSSRRWRGRWAGRRSQAVARATCTGGRRRAASRGSAPVRGPRRRTIRLRLPSSRG